MQGHTQPAQSDTVTLSYRILFSLEVQSFFNLDFRKSEIHCANLHFILCARTIEFWNLVTSKNICL